MLHSHWLPLFRLRYGGRAGKCFITEFGKAVTLTVSRVAEFAAHDVLRKAGWADYAPLRFRIGGAAGRRLLRIKTQTWTFAFLSSFQHTATAVCCPSPFEPLIIRFATGAKPHEYGISLKLFIALLRCGKVDFFGACIMRFCVRSKPFLFFLVVGEARRRGGGTI